MSFITNLFSGGASTLVDSVGKVLDNLVTTKEEKGQLDLEQKKAEQQLQLDMRNMDIQEKQMILNDTANARQRETSVQTSEQATKLAKNISPYLALGTTILTLTLFFILVFSPEVIKPESKDVLMYILGVLSAVLTQIYSYYFGSSSGSAEKNKTISAAIKS